MKLRKTLASTALMATVVSGVQLPLAHADTPAARTCSSSSASMRGYCFTLDDKPLVGVPLYVYKVKTVNGKDYVGERVTDVPAFSNLVTDENGRVEIYQDAVSQTEPLVLAGDSYSSSFFDVAPIRINQQANPNMVHLSENSEVVIVTNTPGVVEYREPGGAKMQTLLEKSGDVYKARFTVAAGSQQISVLSTDDSKQSLTHTVQVPEGIRYTVTMNVADKARLTLQAYQLEGSLTTQLGAYDSFGSSRDGSVIVSQNGKELMQVKSGARVTLEPGTYDLKWVSSTSIADPIQYVHKAVAKPTYNTGTINLTTLTETGANGNYTVRAVPVSTSNPGAVPLDIKAGSTVLPAGDWELKTLDIPDSAYPAEVKKVTVPVNGSVDVSLKLRTQAEVESAHPDTTVGTISLGGLEESSVTLEGEGYNQTVGVVNKEATFTNVPAGTFTMRGASGKLYTVTVKWNPTSIEYYENNPEGAHSAPTHGIVTLNQFRPGDLVTVTGSDGTSLKDIVNDKGEVAFDLHSGTYTVTARSGGKYTLTLDWSKESDRVSIAPFTDPHEGSEDTGTHEGSSTPSNPDNPATPSTPSNPSTPSHAIQGNVSINLQDEPEGAVANLVSQSDSTLTRSASFTANHVATFTSLPSGVYTVATAKNEYKVTVDWNSSNPIGIEFVRSLAPSEPDPNPVTPGEDEGVAGLASLGNLFAPGTQVTVTDSAGNKIGTKTVSDNHELSFRLHNGIYIVSTDGGKSYKMTVDWSKPAGQRLHLVTVNPNHPGPSTPTTPANPTTPGTNPDGGLLINPPVAHPSDGANPVSISTHEPGAVVTVSNPDTGETITTARADDKGNVIFKLPTGRYYVSTPGFEDLIATVDWSKSSPDEMIKFSTPAATDKGPNTSTGSHDNKSNPSPSQPKRDSEGSSKGGIIAAILGILALVGGIGWYLTQQR